VKSKAAEGGSQSRQSRWAACCLGWSVAARPLTRFRRPSSSQLLHVFCNLPCQKLLLVLAVAVGRRPPGLERSYLRVGYAPAHQVTSPILVRRGGPTAAWG
jgi:hypothetical protein